MPAVHHARDRHAADTAFSGHVSDRRAIARFPWHRTPEIWFQLITSTARRASHTPIFLVRELASGLTLTEPSSGAALYPVLFSRTKEFSDERCKSFGRHAQRRIYSHVGRQAREVGRQRSALRGLGNVSPQRFVRGSQPDLCVANERLVRPSHSALRRRRQNMVSAGHSKRRGNRPRRNA